MIDIREHGGIFGGTSKIPFYRLPMDNLPQVKMINPKVNSNIVTILDDRYAIVSERFSGSSTSYIYSVLDYTEGRVLSSTASIGELSSGLLSSLTSISINEGKKTQTISYGNKICIIHYISDNSLLFTLTVDMDTLTIESDFKRMNMFTITVPNQDRLRVTYRQKYQQLLFWNEYQPKDKIVCISTEKFLSKKSFTQEDVLWEIRSRDLPYIDFSTGDYLIDEVNRKSMKVSEVGEVESVQNLEESLIKSDTILAEDGIINMTQTTNTITYIRTDLETGRIVYTNSVNYSLEGKTNPVNKLGYIVEDGKFIISTGWFLLVIDYSDGGVSSPIIRKHIKPLSEKSSVEKAGVSYYKDSVLRQIFSGNLHYLKVLNKM